MPGMERIERAWKQDFRRMLRNGETTALSQEKFGQRFCCNVPVAWELASVL